MTRMIDALAERAGAQRVGIAILLGITGLFLLGIAAGVVVSMIEHGHLPSRTWVLALPFVAAPLGLFGIYAAWRLAAPPASASPYEKRYWRTWLIVIALSVPVGIVLAMSSRDSGLGPVNPFVSAPIAAPLAILLTVLVIGTFVVSLALYHRAIDDHEERAYLWGSQIAYYFLILAFPAWWLLGRGGMVGPLTTVVAFWGLFISLLLQGSVWAWKKFR